MTLIVNGVNQTGALGTIVEVAELEALAKGELILGDGSGPPVALTVGTNTFILVADSTEATGVKWVTLPAAPTHALSHVDGTDDIRDATAALKGVATAAQIAKLDAIEAAATADQTGAQIKTAYEGEANTNAFADADVTTLASAEQSANKNVNNGYAPLDGSAEVPLANLPASVLTGSEYKGVWNAATNTPTLADGVGANGDYHRCSADGAVDFGAGSITFNIGDLVLYNETTAIWENISGNPDLVQSVAGKQGVVTLDAADVAETGGLKIMTGDERTKLSGVDTGAKDDQTGAEIKTAYQAEANAYTDTKNTKLGGIETAADVTDAANVAAALDAGLTAIAALVSAANKIAYATGDDTWALTDFTAAARTLMDDASVAAMVTTLGLAEVAGYGNGYLSARRSSTQSITGSAWTTVQLNIEDQDPNSDFASFIHTPTIAGKWLYLAQVPFIATDDGDKCRCSIDKNASGSGDFNGEDIAASGSGDQTIVKSFAVHDMNGSTDTAEVRVWHNSDSALNIGDSGGGTWCHLIGIRIGP